MNGARLFLVQGIRISDTEPDPNLRIAEPCPKVSHVNLFHTKLGVGLVCNHPIKYKDSCTSSG